MADMAFLVRIHPKISETFILGEILGLERMGMQLSVFSLYRPTDSIAHPANATVKASVRYGEIRNWLGVLRLAAAHLSLLAAQPLRYAATLWFVVRRAEADRVRDFLNGGWLGMHMRHFGLRHVHAHFASEPAAVAEIASKMTGITYSISAHAKDIYTSSPAVLRRKLAGSKFAVTCTQYNRRHLQSGTIGASQVHCCYHGVDTEKFSPGSRQGRDGTPLILGIGRLKPKKGFAILIEACRMLREANLEFHCEIVGYGEEHASLCEQIARCGLTDAVRLVGVLPQDSVISLFRRASLFVLPCQIAADGDRDGIPNVLVEAMAMRVPVISTPISGIPELIEDGKTGLLSPAGDAQALALAMQHLLSDRLFAERLAYNGLIQVTERFSGTRNISTLHQLLLSAISPGGKPTNLSPVGSGSPTTPSRLVARD